MTEYKKVKIGPKYFEIPKDWKSKKIGFLVKKLKGKKPEFILEERKNGFKPYILAESFNNKVYNKFTNATEVICKRDDIIMIGDGSGSGIVDLGHEGVIGSTMMVLRNKSDEIKSLYLFYYIRSKYNLISSLLEGTGIPHVPKDFLRILDVVFPSFPEQEKIANILSSVDELITKTNEIIEKNKELKKGLMQELLTKGIGHKQYKKIEIALKEIRFPVNWDILPLIQLADKKNSIVAGPFGSNLKVEDYKDKGLPIIRLKNIERNQFIDDDIKFVSYEKYQELKYHSFKSGDIVLAKLGDPIGKTCIIPNNFDKGIVVADVVRIRITEKTNKIFLMYMLNSYICFNQLKIETIGSTRPRVNLSQVRNVIIPLPSLPEQEKIANMLSSVDDKIKNEQEYKKQLMLLKKGLMRELLMGKVRVKA